MRRIREHGRILPARREAAAALRRERSQVQATARSLADAIRRNDESERFVAPKAIRSAAMLLTPSVVTRDRLELRAQQRDLARFLSGRNYRSREKIDCVRPGS
jgi:hypothetical protein